MRLRNRYSCIYICKEKEKKPLYFELSIIDKDLNNIVSQINKEFNLDFIINTSSVDENYGILLKDDKIKEDSNILYICHSANLDNFVENNKELHNKNNLEQMIYLFMEFVKVKNLN
jgi:hypothetical protein